jgi:hypothetical protein
MDSDVRRDFINVFTPWSTANAAAGNLANVATDWSHLPRQYHSHGLEVILQTHLFAGFPRAINALATIHQIGIDPEDGSWAEEKDAPTSWKDSGGKTCETVYGGMF